MRRNTMTDKELEVLLTRFQTNLAVVKANDDLQHSSKGQDLVEKAIKNLDGVLTELDGK